MTRPNKIFVVWTKYSSHCFRSKKSAKRYAELTNSKVTEEKPKNYFTCIECTKFYDCWEDECLADHPICDDFVLE